MSARRSQILDRSAGFDAGPAPSTRLGRAEGGVHAAAKGARGVVQHAATWRAAIARRGKALFAANDMAANLKAPVQALLDAPRFRRVEADTRDAAAGSYM